MRHGKLRLVLAERRPDAEAWIVRHSCAPGRGVETAFAFRRNTKRADVVRLVAEAVERTLEGCPG